MFGLDFTSNNAAAVADSRSSSAAKHGSSFRTISNSIQCAVVAVVAVASLYLSDSRFLSEPFTYFAELKLTIHRRYTHEEYAFFFCWANARASRSIFNVNAKCINQIFYTVHFSGYFERDCILIDLLMNVGRREFTCECERKRFCRCCSRAQYWTEWKTQVVWSVRRIRR